MNVLQWFKTIGVLCLVVAAAGCSGGESSAGTGSGGSGNGGSGNGGSGGSSAAALSISNLVAVESPFNVLAYDVSWTSSAAADTELDVACNGLTPWTISGSTAGTKHHIFLMGLVAGVTCTLTAKDTAAGQTASEQTTIHVSFLPGFLPPIALTVPPVGGAVAPGWTLIDLSNVQSGLPYVAALLDSRGRYRWYYRYPGSVPGDDTPVSAYENGVVIGGRDIPLSYVTWQGELVWKDTLETFHHEARAAETKGAFYSLGGYQCSTPANAGGQIVEYDSNTNQDVWKWNLCEHYMPPQDIPDWSHMNTVALFPDHKFLIASSRNQNSIFKINRATGDLVWVMGFHGEVEDGFHGDFTVADADRFYHQHDTTVLPNGHILMFDNGRTGVRAYSRALEVAYTYNPGGTSEAHAVWEFRHSPDIFADIWGSAQRLDNGNTLVCFGQRDPGTQATLTEATAADKPVWEVTAPELWGIYRAERIDAPRGSVIP